MFISKLQQETLKLVDDMINKNMTYNDILSELQDKGYELRIMCKNGYIPTTKVELCKIIDNKEEYSFVDLRKRRNGLAYWETIRLS